MTPVELSRTVLHAVRRAVDEGELSVTVPERAVVAPPGPGGCGDYATNVALQLARPAGQPPQRVAEILRARLLDEQRFTDVVVTGPGFLNFSLRGTASADLVEEVLRRGLRYGHATTGFSGTAVGISCPAEVRAVVVADAVSRVLRSQGAYVRVECEGRPAPEWQSVLGADVTTPGPRTADTHVRTADRHVRTADRHVRTADTHVRTADTHVRTADTYVRVADTYVRVAPVPAPADPLPLGRDAARWALLHPAAHDRPRIPGDHLVQREGNPLFRVRYAHARTRALLRNAADLGFHPEPGPVSEADALTALIGDHPRVLAATATHHTPDRLARHLLAVADAAMPLLPAVLPLGEEKPSAAHRARLALAEAVGTVLAGGLSLLGIDAPDHL
ncbi:arginyl-tRNA synthetase [Streptomyces sp. Ag82_O1-12]|uniref:ArgS-related anticodon-binding protein NrtL n=1 Tax=unclassified Streptomyces TaxID=2593676 RepID=UPI000BD0252E|nr:MULTISPECIES: DALR anticodon-binding domain-containing protein [unclassified Streptomyces]SMQ18939.1 arginyl-tRNA synthetase [Streptomyces sp. Ag82_O1-12]SOD47980.1 arginyl-tRNA synthetase [Streptomyces sp. Ag82_G6-1]